MRGESAPRYRRTRRRQRAARLHHLATLRDAGFVTMRGEGVRTTRHRLGQLRRPARCVPRDRATAARRRTAAPVRLRASHDRFPRLGDRVPDAGRCGSGERQGVSLRLRPAGRGVHVLRLGRAGAGFPSRSGQAAEDPPCRGSDAPVKESSCCGGPAQAPRQSNCCAAPSTPPADYAYGPAAYVVGEVEAGWVRCRGSRRLTERTGWAPGACAGASVATTTACVRAFTPLVSRTTPVPSRHRELQAHPRRPPMPLSRLRTRAPRRGHERIQRLGAAARGPSRRRKWCEGSTRHAWRRSSTQAPRPAANWPRPAWWRTWSRNSAASA